MLCGGLFSRPITVLTVQALSEDDHRFWMQAMGGKEPVRQSFTSASNHSMKTILWFSVDKTLLTFGKIAFITY